MSCFGDTDLFPTFGIQARYTAFAFWLVVGAWVDRVFRHRAGKPIRPRLLRIAILAAGIFVVVPIPVLTHSAMRGCYKSRNIYLRRTGSLPFERPLHQLPDGYLGRRPGM